MLIGTVLLGLVAAGLFMIWRPLSLVVVPFVCFLFAFFRDPERAIPDGEGVMVSPADGMVSDIIEIEQDELLGGPAVRIGIFLSVFNVHVNRAPCDGKVVDIRYKKGKFINALHHTEASAENESNTLVLADAEGAPVAVVRQIVGLIARRIVCSVDRGESVERGQRIGMIKFGSRTELYLPKRLEVSVQVKVGQKVRGAADVLAIVKNAAPVKTR